MSRCDWFTWHVGTWSGVSAGEVIGELAEVVGELAVVVAEIAEVPNAAWSHLRHDVSMASSELNRG